jgi:transposase
VADNQGLLELSEEQRGELRGWAQSRSLPAGYVFRARLILALADGLTYRQIEQTLGASAPTVSKWKIRFEEHGIEGLQGRHQGSKPRRATPAVQGRVIRRAQQKPSDGSTHWSCRKLAEELGVSKSTVQRILAQAKLRPHRLESYMASNDPEFPGLRAKPVASVSTRTLSPVGCHRSRSMDFASNSGTAIRNVESPIAAMEIAPS